MIFGYARVSTKDQNLERQLQRKNQASPPANGLN